MPYIPTDPLYAQQWHFTAMGMRGANRGIELIWDDYRGAGIWVQTYETSDRAHVDLNDNYDGTQDLVDNGVPDPGLPSGPTDEHGTHVAGLIAAENNGIGVVGIAFDCSISSATTTGAFRQPTRYDVINASWGFGSNYTAFALGLDGTGYEVTVDDGRAGLGTAMIRSAGNANVVSASEGMTGSRYTTTVASVLQSGFKAGYSCYGSAILVTAPGGNGDVVTVDNSGAAGGNTQAGAAGDYMFQFGATSAAAPMVSGVVTLMLDANPYLGWRDVQDILAASAVRTGSALLAGPSNGETAGWVFNRANTWNGGGMHISADYGYGMVNVFNAVRLAEAAGYVGHTAQTSGNELTATSGTVTNTQPIAGTVAIPITVNASFMELDHVAVTLNITEANFSHLTITLISPEGTSTLLHDAASGAGAVTAAAGPGGLTWMFGADHLRGESPNGQWQLQVVDTSPGNRNVQTVKIDVYGSYADAHDVYIYTDELTEVVNATGEAARRIMNDSVGDNWFNGATLTGNLNLNMAPGTASTLSGAAFISTSATNRLIGAIGGDGNDEIFGNTLDNRIYGGRGEDNLYGGDGNDLINGGRGIDDLLGDAGIDTVDYKGSKAAVIIDLSAPVITERARGGDAEGDVLYNFGADNSFENVNGSDREDRLTGDYRANVLSGEQGDDLLNGLGDADRLNGARGGDVLIGGIGGDNVSGGEGSDTIFGDQLLFFASTTGTNHILSFDEVDNKTLQRALNLDGLFAITPDVNVTNVATVPHVTVTGEGDGSVAYFNFFAFAGESATFDIDGTSAGYDSWVKLYDSLGVEIAQNNDGAIDAGSTVSTDSFLSFNFTSNQLYTIAVGRNVAGVFSPIANNDDYTLHISLTNPSTTVQGGDDTLFGDMGSDEIDGGTGNDTIFGDQNLINPSPGQVTKTVGLGNNSIDRALNVDGTFSLAADPIIQDSTTKRHTTVNATTDGAVDFYAFTVTAVSTGLSTFDIDNAPVPDLALRLFNADGVVLADNKDNNKNGNTTVDPGSIDLLDSFLSYKFAATGTYYIGVYWSTGDDSFDELPATPESYSLHISLENPSLVSGGGDDNLRGGSGDDTLNGGGGQDMLDGGLGNDTMAGGGGNDTYFDTPGDTVSEALGAGSDTVNTVRNSYTLGANVERVNFVGSGNFVGTGTSINNRFQGGTGDDRFVDVLGGTDIFSGNAGTDTVDFRTSGVGTTINLTTNAHGGAAAGDSYSGIEKFLGSNTAGDTMTGGGIGRWVFAGGGGDDTLTGGVKNDQLLGQGGNDTLVGGNDRDSLDGGTGNDTMTGGSQGDVFVFIDAAFGQDVISDFQDGADRLKIFSAVADDIADFTIANNGTTSVTVILNADTANFITLNGAAPISITNADLVFY